MHLEAQRLAERVAALPAAQRQLLLKRLAQQNIDASALPIVPFRRDETLPASHAQRGLWLTWRMAPDSPAYNMAGTLVLSGPLDVGALRAAVADLSQRHEVLRTSYRLDDQGELQQCIRADDPSSGLEEGALGDVPAAGREAQAEHWMAEHARRPFDLEHGPVWRVGLLRVDADTHWLSIVVHHIAADGWSESVLLGDLSRCYEARAARTVPQLPALPVQFADHAKWQREWQAAGETERQLAHWQARLAGTGRATLPLPLDRARPRQRSDAGGLVAFTIPQAVAAGLQQLAERSGATLFMVMLSLLKLVLARRCGASDIAIGSPVAQRDRAETHGLVGYLTNILVLRTRVDWEGDFLALVSSVRETVLDAHAHAGCPFDLLVSALADERVEGIHPLFQVKCAEQHDAGLPRGFGGLLAGTRAPRDVRAHFDLSLDFSAGAGGIACELVYAADIFEHATVARLAGMLERAARDAVARPDSPLASLAGDEAVSQLAGEALPGAPDDVLARWSRTVGENPQALAVRFEDETITRADLDAQSSTLAARLVALGITREVRVGVHAPRSIELVLGLLAVLKAGGVYVPLDPGLPAERLAWQARDSGIAVLLSAGEPAWDSRVPVEALRLAPCMSGSPVPWQSAPTHPVQAAYLIYTSGSTGRPKGVVVGRGALASYVQGVLARLALGPASSMAMVSTPAADLGHTVLFGALCAGHALHMLSPGRAFDPDRFGEYMRARQVGVLKIVPSHLRALLNAADPASVLPHELLVLGGEATDRVLLDRLRRLAPALRVLNHYGPTETSVGILTQEAAQASSQAATLPIGRPLPGACAWVVDEGLRPVPRGVAGELLLGGPGLARGYLARPGITAERFIASPFDAAQRLYRSGDRVRVLDDGSLEFLGRSDDQVKLHGYRVELKEVELALQRQPGVRQAAAIVRGVGQVGQVGEVGEMGDVQDVQDVEDVQEAGEARLQLFGYVSGLPGTRPDAQALRAALGAELPDYMVPVHIEVLDALPLNANGKLDHRALPHPAPRAERGHEAPRGELETAVAQIWQEVLGIARVSRRDSFFTLGGDSILSLKVVARARKRGLRLSPRQLFEHSSLAGLAEAMGADATAAAAPVAAIPVLSPERRAQPLPVSHAQARQWFLWQLDPSSSAYHMAGALRIEGALDETALRASFDALVRRHEALRTVFTADADGRVWQQVRAEAAFGMSTQDLRAHEPPQREALAQAQLQRWAETPFDLATGPLLRVGLLRLAEQEHLLAVVMHHIVSDGWSVQVIVKDFVAAYRARTRPTPEDMAASQDLPAPPDLPPPPPLQYADFAVWQRAWLDSGEKERQLQYWKTQLGTEHPVLQLGTDHPRRADGRYRVARHRIDVPRTLVQALQRRAQAEGATLFMLLLSAWQVLLHRHSGLDDIRVGVPVANRQRAETEGIVGLFVNTQVLRCRLHAGLTLDQVLRQVKEAALGAQAHQDLPFEQLVEALQPDRSLGHGPLFQVMHDHQRDDRNAVHPLPGLRLSPHPIGEQAAQFELGLDTLERPDGQLEAHFSHARELFEPTTMARLARHFVALLEAFAHRPQCAVGEVALLDADDLQALRTWSVNDHADAGLLPVHELIGRQARQTPEAVAVVFDGVPLSYRALDTQANRLAHALRQRGVGVDVLVGVAVDRSAAMLVAVLAVLKAGGAYVPLDPALPAQRLDHMVRDSGLRLVLAQGDRPGFLRGSAVDAIDIDAPDLHSYPCKAPEVSVHGEALAYAIYTSGSTGRPKGVMVRHRALSQFLLSMRREPGLGSQDVLVAVTPLSFDIAALELYLPLVVGARVVIAPRDTARDGTALARLVAESGATVLQATPSGWRVLREGGWPRGVPQGFKGLVGGEALQPDLAQDLLGLGIGLWNMYGPTETTIWSTASRVGRGHADRPGIQGPIASTRLLVLDAGLNPVPPNVPGELVLGGIGLARGYLGRAGLTAERFIADPQDEHGGRLYRTGDLVRWRNDGQLEYLGRIDHQVKIRGLRIELGEIEAQLLAQPGVAQAVVVAQDGAGGPRLVAYVVKGQGDSGQGAGALRVGDGDASPAGDADAWRAALAQALPDYMVPAVIVPLASLPLNANGKVDRQALPPAPQAASEQADEAPQGEAEQALASIWAEVLGVPRVGRHDDFFALGGHSLLATQLASRVRSQRGLQLPLRLVFEHPVLHAMAAALGQRAAPAHAPVDTPASGSAPAPALPGAGPALDAPRRHALSFAQQRLWFLWKLDPGSAAFNLSGALHLRGRLDAEALAFAFQQLVQRHAALRTVFFEEDGAVWQRVDEGPCARTAQIASIEVPDTPAPDDPRVQELIDAQWRQPFDLARGPLLRTRLLRLAPASHVLLVAMHHIVSDAWSMRVLMAEFAQLYGARTLGRTVALAPPRIDYAGFAQSQRQWLEAGEMARQLAHWTSRLQGVPPLVLAADKPLPAQRRHPGAVVDLAIDGTLSLRVSDVARRHGASVFMLLLAAFSLAAAERCGESVFLVGTDMANRNRDDTEGVVGFFVNQVALPIDCAAPPSFAALLQQLRHTVADAADHQDLPFDRLVDALRVGRRDGRAPLFQLKVLYREDDGPPLVLPGLQVAELPLGEKQAELDLIVAFTASAGRIALALKYDAEVFDEATLRSLGAEIVAVLDAAVTDPQAPLARLRAEAAAARRQAAQRLGDERARRLSGLRAGLKARAAPAVPSSPA